MLHAFHIIETANQLPQPLVGDATRPQLDMAQTNNVIPIEDSFPIDPPILEAVLARALFSSYNPHNSISMIATVTTTKMIIGWCC